MQRFELTPDGAKVSSYRSRQRIESDGKSQASFQDGSRRGGQGRWTLQTIRRPSTGQKIRSLRRKNVSLELSQWRENGLTDPNAGPDHRMSLEASLNTANGVRRITISSRGGKTTVDSNRNAGSVVTSKLSRALAAVPEVKWSGTASMGTISGKVRSLLGTVKHLVKPE